MPINIDVIRKTNQTFIGMMNGLSVEQLNAIPADFNNNIIWNFAHSLAVQQAFFYGLSGLPYTIEKEFINRYKKGTRPEEFISETEFSNTIEIFTTAINTLENDYKNGVFNEYQPYTTSIGFIITNIDEAIQAASFHDGWHFGYARVLKKLVLLKQGV